MSEQPLKGFGDKPVTMSDLRKLSSFGDKKPTLELVEKAENKPARIAKEKDLDSQTETSGNPSAESLDSNISKDGGWIAKDEPALDSNISKEKSLDSQKNQKKGKWSKYEKARSTVPILIRTSGDLVKEIKHFNVENNFDMRDFFELAARSFLDGFGNPNANGLDIKLSLDDRRLKMFYKTNISIINLFREYQRIFHASPEWKPKDDAVGVKYNDIDLRIIEIGIIQTQGNIIENENDTKPERFKYYTREIDKFGALGYPESMLDIILETNRKRWSEITKKASK